MLLAAITAFAQVPSPAERSSAPAHDISREQLLAELRRGGYVLYIRHTATDFSRDDSKMKDYEDCANQRPLTAQGRDDARAIGQRLRELGIPVGEVLASPFCRTIETANLIFGRAQKMNEVRGGAVSSSDPNRYAGLRKLFSGASAHAASNRAIASHGNPFYAVAGPPYLSEGEMAVIRPLGNDFEVIARIKVADWAKLEAAR